MRSSKAVKCGGVAAGIDVNLDEKQTLIATRKEPNSLPRKSKISKTGTKVLLLSHCRLDSIGEVQLNV